LVLRFALISLIAFLAIGAALSVLAAQQIRNREETTAASHVRFVAEAILRYEFQEQGLFATSHPPPLKGRQYDELQTFVQTHIINGSLRSGTGFQILRVKVWRSDGMILFSDAPDLVGKKFGVDESLRRSFAGSPFSEVSDLTAPEEVDERGLAPKLLSTYVPLRLGRGETGPVDVVVEIYQDYGGIQHQVTTLQRILVVILICGLGALYLITLPIFRRLGRTMSLQYKTVSDQARRLTELLEKEQKNVAELQELNRLKTEFVAIASHELRTPVTSIIGYLKTLRRPEFEEDPEMRREFLEAMERQGDRLSRLVENLLSTARLEDRALNVTVEPVEFRTFAAEMVKDLGVNAERVRLAVPEGLPRVNTDRQLLEHIVGNLLDNALKYSAPTAGCELAARLEGWSTLAISVRDKGIGIPEEEQQKIFDRFYQVDSSSTRSFSGLGLGLSLVKELTTTLGGTVDVWSEPGKGSVFTFRLPLAGPHSEKPRSDGTNGYQAAVTVDPHPNGVARGLRRSMAGSSTSTM
jgi:signal transduction histidine kinase